MSTCEEKGSAPVVDRAPAFDARCGVDTFLERLKRNPDELEVTKGQMEVLRQAQEVLRALDVWFVLKN